MILAVKGCLALLPALLLPIGGAWAAEDGAAAAVGLARKTASLAGRGEMVAVIYKNISSIPPAEWNGVRMAFEAALRDAGCRAGDTGATEARLTMSETPTQYLVVEEARKGDERQVWIASWSRAEGSPAKPAGISLELKPVWRQKEQILDVAFPPAGMLVVSAAKVTLYARSGETWVARDSVVIPNSRPWPRDLRGRVRATGATFQLFLPGVACNGNTDAALALDCRASDAPWVLESGGRALLLATFMTPRNYFDGRVVTQSGARKTVSPFYSAASVESQGRTLWIMAQTDGRAQIVDASLDPVGSIAQWGSDIVGIDARCGSASQVLATRAGDGGEPDALQSFTVADRAATPVTAAAPLPGPVTALWPSGPAAALAITRDLVSGEYIAYLATISCR
jgi:hypothetical protein